MMNIVYSNGISKELTTHCASRSVINQYSER